MALAGLVAVALAAGFLSRSGDGQDTTPSVDNRGPFGVAALYTWLAEAGRATRWDGPLTSFPAGRHALVLVAPARAELEPAEVDAVLAHVTSGGTLVYLASRSRPQPALDARLGVRPGPAPPRVDRPEDPSGTVVGVEAEAGPLAGLTRLRVRSDRQIIVDRPEAVPLARSGALWWFPLGAGEVYVGGGPELAQNLSLLDEDNAALWSRLAGAAPLVFAEYHHSARAVRAAPLSFTAALLQFVVLALAVVWWRAPRLGPPRSPPAPARSVMEYVEAMASLTRRARVEPEIVRRLVARGEQLARENARTAAGPKLASQLEALRAATSVLDASVHLARMERHLAGVGDELP